MELLVGVHDEIAVIFVLVSSSKVIPGTQRLKNYRLGSKLPVHERPTPVSVKE
jgi:hypothetical protein